MRSALVLAVLLAGCTGAPVQTFCCSQETATVSFHTPNGTFNVTTVVADTPQERQEGLMFHKTLPHDGMLFSFPSRAERVFWMKNTSLPLDIIFIDEDTVVNVEQAAPGLGIPAPQLPRYRSSGPANYVVEVEQGLAVQHGISAGTRVTVSHK